RVEGCSRQHRLDIEGGWAQRCRHPQPRSIGLCGGRDGPGAGVAGRRRADDSHSGALVEPRSGLQSAQCNDLYHIGSSFLQDQPADANRATFRQIHDKLAATPGVEAVSFDWGAHPMKNDDEESFWFVGRPKPAHQSDLAMAVEYVVEPDYLRAMQIQLKHGRFFTPADNEHAP